MGTSKRRRSDRAGRGPIRSPGRPTAGRREHRQAFWMRRHLLLPRERETFRQRVEHAREAESTQDGVQIGPSFLP